MSGYIRKLGHVDSRLGPVNERSSKVYAVPEDVLFQEVNGEIVVLSMTSGMYYGMNEIASRMWSLIRERTDFETLVETLLDEYDVAESQLREDISRFIQELVSAGLLKEEDD